MGDPTPSFTVPAGLAYTVQAEYWAGVSDTAKEFVRVCLTVDPTNRPTAKELLTHKWLQLDDQVAAKRGAGAVDLLPQVKAAFDAKKTCKYLSSPHWTCCTPPPPPSPKPHLVLHSNL